jgi:hypothetical protein
MRQKIHRNNIGRIAAALITILFSIFFTLPVQAQSLSENFVFKFEPVVYDRSQTVSGEVFQATFKGHAACNKTLPVPVSEAVITMQIVAENTAGGPEVILNPELTISVKPFPDKEGETFDLIELILLQFPAGTEPGEYRITGKFLEAKGKVILIWADFSGYLPSEQDMGTMKCALPGTNLTPVPVSPTENTAVSTQPTPSVTSPATPVITTATPPQTSPQTSPLLLPTLSTKDGQESFFSWWVILLILTAVITVSLVIILLVKRRE